MKINKHQVLMSILSIFFFSQIVFAEPAAQWICQNRGFEMPALVVVNNGHESYTIIKDVKVCERLGIKCPFMAVATVSDSRPDWWPVIAGLSIDDQVRLRAEPNTGGMVLQRWMRSYRSYVAVRGTDWYFHYGECRQY